MKQDELKHFKCENCDAEWSLPEIVNEVPEKCPFCGKKRRGFYPGALLRRILQQFGIGIFEDERRFKAVVEDFFYKDKGRAKRLLLAQREGLHRRYQEISLCSDEIRQKVLRKKCITYMENELGMAEQYAMDMEDMFYVAFCNDRAMMNYGDADETYYHLANNYQYEDEEAEENEENSVLFYRIMAISAYAGNIDAQKIICKKFVWNRVDWIDNRKVFEWANTFYDESVADYDIWSMGDNEEGETYAAIIGDSYAYGTGVQRDANRALEWYELSGESCIFLYVYTICMDRKIIKNIVWYWLRKRANRKI